MAGQGTTPLTILCGASEGGRVAFSKIAELSELEDGGVLAKRVGELAIGLYRRGEEVFAMEDTCPHAGYPLSAGRFADGIIECAAHGYCFDVRTGFAPDDSDGFPIPCFPVRIENGAVWVDLENPHNLKRRMPPGIG